MKEKDLKTRQGVMSCVSTVWLVIACILLYYATNNSFYAWALFFFGAYLEATAWQIYLRTKLEK